MPPLTIMVKPVSGRCNMRCRYCFYADVSHHRSVKTYELMSQATLEALVRRAMAYADGTVSFAFQGGEPTLAGVAFYEQLIALQKKYNARGLTVHNSIQTNGYDLPDEMIDLFARERFLVGVSLDGCDADHDRMRTGAHGEQTAAIVRDTLRRLDERGVEFNILCVVNAHVAARPCETFEALKGYRYLQFIACLDDLDGQAREYSLTPAAYGHFLKQTFDLYERAFWDDRAVSVRLFDNYLGILMGRESESCAMRGVCAVYYLVEGDGGVYPCDFYVLDPWHMGNVNEASFYKLEQSAVGRAFREASTYVSPECRACRWRALCRGGCRRDREPFTDGRPGLNKWCESYQSLFEHAFDRMRRMADAIARR